MTLIHSREAAQESMAEEPSLPTLPVVSWDERSQSFSNTRKRLKLASSSGGSSLYSSSDPAIFSSDDDPGLDNYVSGRHKRKYVGSWYNQMPASSDSTYNDGSPLPRPKRTLRRQLDSGVYLGSDGTDTDETLELPPLESFTKFPVIKPPAPRISDAEKAAREKIRTCLEQGEETVDFWSMGLRELSNETIMPLAQLSHIPQVTKDVAFEQKDVEPKIYLARNSLTQLPGALFDLSHLTVLSIRENKLSELPPSICKLKNLTELNIAQNRLHYLPAEFLDLFGKEAKLKKLVLFPNPFFRPDGDMESEVPREVKTVQRLSDWHPRFFSRHLGRTELQFATSQGRVISQFRVPSGEFSGRLPVWLANNTETGDIRPSKVSSLMEIALRSCYSLDKPQDLTQYLPEGLDHVGNILDEAAAQKFSGGNVCSHCRRLLIRPPLEWIEWRQVWVTAKSHGNENTSSNTISIKPLSMAMDEISVAFKRRACSWKCGPIIRSPDLGWGDYVKDSDSQGDT